VNPAVYATFLLFHSKVELRHSSAALLAMCRSAHVSVAKAPGVLHDVRTARAQMTNPIRYPVDVTLSSAYCT
jgi:hypothetical protein